MFWVYWVITITLCSRLGVVSWRFIFKGYRAREGFKRFVRKLGDLRRGAVQERFKHGDVQMV